MSQRNADRAVIEQQRRMLLEKAERIQALEVELEGTRALCIPDPDELLQTWQQLARVYRVHRDFLRAQVNLALELLEARGIVT